jgi:lipoyl(octanoyl) transferase
MALDEALLLKTTSENTLPTLRLYSWSPPAISLGYAQHSNDIDFSALSSLGWGLVRRPTGGKAVLHTDELTYSIIAPLENKVVEGSLLESYFRIAKALLLALDFLGVKAESEKKQIPQVHSQTTNPICFEVTSNYEITAEGKKVIGSSQARKSGGVLQHGSLPLSGDLSRITTVLRYNSESERVESGRKLLDHAATLETIYGSRISWQSAANAFLNAFSSVFDIQFELTEPTQPEIELATDLQKSKYASEAWNLRL